MYASSCMQARLQIEQIEMLYYNVFVVSIKKKIHFPCRIFKKIDKKLLKNLKTVRPPGRPRAARGETLLYTGTVEYGTVPVTI